MLFLRCTCRCMPKFRIIWMCTKIFQFISCSTTQPKLWKLKGSILLICKTVMQTSKLVKTEQIKQDVCVCVCVTEYSPSGNGGFCEPVELPLLCRLLSLLTDRLDFNFLCILCDTGVDSCLLGCSVVVSAVVAAELVPEPDPDPPLLPPQEHTCVAPAPLVPPSVPLHLLNMGVSAPSLRKQFLSFLALLFVRTEGTNWDSDRG